MISLGHGVGAQALIRFQRVGKGFDTAGIDSLHQVDQAQNAVQGLGGAWKIGFDQAQAGQVSDFLHVGAFKRHGDLQWKTGRKVSVQLGNTQ